MSKPDDDKDAGKDSGKDDTPKDATEITRPMDPADVADFGIAFLRDGSRHAVLESDESIASFTLKLSQRAVEAGLIVKQDDVYPAPFVADNVVRFWLAVEPARQDNPEFRHKGLTLPLELTFTTNGTPPRTKQRTVTVTVRER